MCNMLQAYFKSLIYDRVTFIIFYQNSRTVIQMSHFKQNLSRLKRKHFSKAFPIYSSFPFHLKYLTFAFLWFWFSINSFVCRQFGSFKISKSSPTRLNFYLSVLYCFFLIGIKVIFVQYINISIFIFEICVTLYQYLREMQYIK